MAYTTINKSSDYFNTKLYTGNGGTQSITGVGFQPDMVWGKDRGNVTNHELHDAVRGATRRIKPNDTDAGQEQANSITAFNADGFSLGSDGDLNGNGNNIVSWNWKANGAGSANTAGSINSTVSVSATSGFSIVSYTGNGTGSSTVGHGLGVAPGYVIIKNTSSTDAWQVFPTGGTRLVLNSTAADYGNNGITKGATTITLPSGVDNAWNTNGQTYIMYCFAEKQGFSKFGSYTGNGNADGPFIYTGFKPAFVMIKGSSIAEAWWMFDSKRSESNVANDGIVANGSNTEYSNSATFKIDILSNGFKIRDSDGAMNSSGNTYIYTAFAEEPLVGDNPATAR